MGMIAVYPGSFDPITSGHFDIIERAGAMFDTLVVLVAINSTKESTFSCDERVEMIRHAVHAHGLTNIQVDSISDGLLVDYAEQRKAKAIIKGLRAVSDFEYEFQMALINRRLRPEIETVFLMTSAEYSFLSSSIVKEIARLDGDISGLVPQVNLRKIQAHYES
jgi:pantetheine-phosphate adenylyltransferase